MRNGSIAILACLVFTQPVMDAQTATQPAFEVASVKAAEPLVVNGWTSSGGMPPIRPDQESLNLPSVSLISLIERAYGVQRPDSVSGPPWLSSERYEIIAKAPQGAKGQLAIMLQNLLGERFHLRTHWENKDVQGYALMAGKPPNRLKLADPASPKGSTSSASGHFVYSRITLNEFATAVGRMMGQPVIDATGVPGEFNITLDASPDSLPGLNPRSHEADSSYPSVFTALKELGLNLEARRVPVRTLVVDSADKVPTAN